MPTSRRQTAHHKPALCASQWPAVLQKHVRHLEGASPCPTTPTQRGSWRPFSTYVCTVTPAKLCVWLKRDEEKWRHVCCRASVHNKWKIGGLVLVMSWRNIALCCEFVSPGSVLMNPFPCAVKMCTYSIYTVVHQSKHFRTLVRITVITHIQQLSRLSIHISDYRLLFTELQIHG